MYGNLQINSKKNRRSKTNKWTKNLIRNIKWFLFLFHRLKLT